VSTALIGHTGFVGSTLLRNRRYDDTFRSTDIHMIRGRRYRTVVCCGAPATKWLANKQPRQDRDNVHTLISHLDSCVADQFILISTVDVFGNACGVDENTRVDSGAASPYGQHRFELEEFVRSRFANSVVIRLPGLCGPGLKKNPLYDLRHDNAIHLLDARSRFQFYPMEHLADDIDQVAGQSVPLVHFAVEPTSLRDVALHGFGVTFEQTLDAQPAAYDVKTIHAGVWGVAGSYIRSAADVMKSIRRYAVGVAEPLPA
jgi:dTDP-4-dehydrorhamnose reductase